MVYDYCVVGGGIVGLATAMKLLEMQPGARLVALEKETGLSRHQTGHNSGVIHAGIYYAPGSLKADLCRRGSKATKEFCWNHRIPFETCGKLLVATNELELQRMNDLIERAKLNQIEVERLDAADLRQREPNIIGVGGFSSRRRASSTSSECAREWLASFARQEPRSTGRHRHCHLGIGLSRKDLSRRT